MVLRLFSPAVDDFCVGSIFSLPFSDLILSLIILVILLWFLLSLFLDMEAALDPYLDILEATDCC